MPKKTDATKHILGFEYQKLIALEYCLNAKENQIVYIECYGDIAIDDMTIEVKNHLTKTYLSDRHIDFWKTLYNLVNNKYEYDSFQHFKLHTTSDIKEDSIFYLWNEQSGTEKLNRIKSVKPNKTISEYQNKIFSEQDSNLESILKRLTIDSSCSGVKEKLDELTKHSSLQFIRKEIKKVHFIEKMIGYITTKSINNSDCWNIETNEFRDDMGYFLSDYINDKIIFPKTKKTEVKINKNENFIFSQQMTDTGFHSLKIDRAINDYLRSEISTIKLLQQSVPCECLESFIDDLKDEVIDIKLTFIQKVPNNYFPCLKNATIDMYDKCLSINSIEIEGIERIQDYYYRGSIHKLVEDKEFSININEV